MKKTTKGFFLLAMIASFFMLKSSSCNGPSTSKDGQSAPSGKNSPNLFPDNDSMAHGIVGKVPAGKYAITPQGTKIDTIQANKQINSYLQAHPNDVKSYYFSTDVIQEYMNSNAKYIKVMLAHSGRYLTNPQDGEEFSLIVVGIDADGKYVVLKKDNADTGDPKYVYNNVAPCPYACGTPGTPMVNLIIKNN